jgi:hypothetical protein
MNTPPTWPPRLKPLVAAVREALHFMRLQAEVARRQRGTPPWR